MKTRSIARSLAIGAGFALGLAMCMGNTSTPEPKPTVDPVTALIEQHDCWTDTAPEGVEPGHVIATTEAGELVYGGPQLVETALEQIFNNADAGLTVHAFCR